MTEQAPPRSVIEAFGAHGSPAALAGGEGSSWRTADLVMKRAPGEAEWAWLGEHLPTVRGSGFRLALPVPTSDGRWVVEGWCAQTWVAGAHATTPRWLEILDLGGRLDAAFAHLPRPDFVEQRVHEWSVADRVAWDEIASPVRHGFLRRLARLRRPLALPAQAMHGDLTDNVLFEPERPPAVIDPTFYWRPAGYASAIVLGDAVRCHGADPGALLASLSTNDAFPQLFVRACIFRLVTTLLFDVEDVEPHARDLELAERIAT